MEQSEIQKRNEAIAKYMGWKPGTVDEEPPNEGYFPPPGVGEASFYFTEDLDFHKEWELLMPVVEKIIKTWDKNRQHGKSVDSTHNFPIHLHNAMWGASNQNMPLIEAVFTAVSDYILSLEK